MNHKKKSPVRIEESKNYKNEERRDSGGRDDSQGRDDWVRVLVKVEEDEEAKIGSVWREGEKWREGEAVRR